MRSMKVICSSLALATAAVVATPASAATTIAIDNGNGFFGQSNIAAGAFSHTFNFTVDLPGVADVGLISFQRMAGITDLAATFNGSTIDLMLDPTTNLIYGSLTKDILSGSHSIVVSGTSAGRQAAYSGTVFFSAIPEPTSWGLMILGFGAAGTMLRRRGQQAVKVSFA